MNTVINRTEIAVPTTMLMLTPDFFGTVLRADVRAVNVLSTNIGNGITSSIVRIGLEYAGGADGGALGLPATLIAKFSSFNDFVRSECARLGFYEREVYFYSELAARTDARTPVCYYAAFDPNEGRCLLLLEDLTDHVRESSPGGGSIEQVRLAVQAMARLHAGWWDRPELHEIPHFFRPPGPHAEIVPAFWDIFRQGMRLGDSPEIRRIEEVLRREVGPAETHLNEGPLTLVHNDFQLDNLSFGPRGQAPEVVLLDWGIYTSARGAADLAYLLVGSLSVEDRRSAEIALMQEYVDALARLGVTGYTLDDCLADYRRAMLVYYTRYMIAISTVGTTDGPDGKVIDPRTMENAMPVLQRYHAAILDHYLER